MSKVPISELVPLIEYFEKKKESQRPRPRRRGFRRYRENDDNLDLGDLYKMKRFADEYNKFLSDQEKINKKDDDKEKKKEKKGWEAMSFMQKLAVLTATVPPAMMAFIILCLLFAKTVSHLI